MRKFSFAVLLSMLVAVVTIGCKPKDDTSGTTTGTGTNGAADDADAAP